MRRIQQALASRVAVWLVAAPFFAATVQAQQTGESWNPAGNPTQPSDDLWSTANNWSGHVVPIAGYKAFVSTATPCIVSNTAGGGQISIGDGGPGFLIVTNGGNLSAGDTTLTNLDTYGWTAIGYSTTGQLTIAAGGSVTFNYHCWIGFSAGSTGTFVMNGGTASVAGAFGLGPSGGTGIVHINGGTLTLSQLAPSAVQGAGSVLDISGGTIVVSGNDVTTVDGLVSSNKITAYGGTGSVNVTYNGSTTTITGTPPTAPSLPPYLTIQMSDGNLAVSWPTSAVYYALQSATNLAPQVAWQSVTNSVVTTNGTNEVFLPAPRAQTYFSLNQGVDASTMNNKLLMGYQGWFGCPGDGSAANQWWHWFHSQTDNATNVNTDLMPDETELTSNELFATQMTYSNGTVVPLYSSAVQQTVVRHFQWMQQNQLDGVMLQRFVTDLSSPQFYAFRNQVTANVMVGAQTYGRVWANMYDVSGEPTNTIISDMTNDWNFLVNTMHITNSPRYLHHKGKPVVVIWGFGFNDSSHLASPAQAQFLINWFKSQGCTVMGGVPSYWRTLSNDSCTNPAWTPVYLSFDVISPWAVGRYGTTPEANSLSEADSYAASVTAPDRAECKTNGVDYMPVVFPGFSWHNENGGPLNQIPRYGGAFYWEQIYNCVNDGCNMIYGAMYDEVNEGTAMYKMVSSSSELPAQGEFLALDADGYTLPSDWYLQLANQAGKMLRGQIPLQKTMPITPP